MKKGKIKALVEFWCEKKMAEVRKEMNKLPSKAVDSLKELKEVVEKSLQEFSSIHRKETDNLLERVQKLEQDGEHREVLDTQFQDAIMEPEKRGKELSKKVQKLEAVKHSNHAADADIYLGFMDFQKFAYPTEKKADEKRDFTNQEVYNMLSSNIEELEYLVDGNHLSPQADRIIKSGLVHLKENVSKINL